MLVLGSVVAVGLSGRVGAPGTAGGAGDATSPAAASAGPSSPVAFPASSFRVVGTPSPRFEPDLLTPPPNPAETSEPGPIALEATRNASSVFVHGDVFADNVTWVYLSLRTLDGQVGGWASVSIPGAAREARGRPALRFDVELAVPTGMAAEVLIVQANAYDVGGALVASTRVRLAADM